MGRRMTKVGFHIVLWKTSDRMVGVICVCLFPNVIFQLLLHHGYIPFFCRFVVVVHVHVVQVGAYVSNMLLLPFDPQFGQRIPCHQNFYSISLLFIAIKWVPSYRHYRNIFNDMSGTSSLAMLTLSSICEHSSIRAKEALTQNSRSNKSAYPNLR